MKSLSSRIIIVLMLALSCAISMQAQDKPRWAIKGTSDINSQRSNDTYTLVKFERFGPSLDNVRNQARRNLPEYFASQFGLDADSASVSTIHDSQRFLSYKGTAANQEEGDLAVLSDYVVSFPGKTFDARLVDEYVSFDENVDGTFDYTLYQLFAVSTAEGRTPDYDNVSYSRDYRGRALMRSIIPGMGQLYKGQKTKAYCIWGGEAVCVALAIYADHRRRQYLDDMRDYDNDDIIHHSYYSKSKSWRLVRNLSIAGAVGIYAYNLIDAALSKGPRKVVLTPAGKNGTSLAFGPTVVYDPSLYAAPAIGMTLTF